MYFIIYWTINDLSDAFPSDFRDYLYLAKIENTTVTDPNEYDLEYECETISCQLLDVKHFCLKQVIRPATDPDTKKHHQWIKAPMGQISLVCKVLSVIWHELDAGVPICWSVKSALIGQIYMTIWKHDQYISNMLSQELHHGLISAQMHVCLSLFLSTFIVFIYILFVFIYCLFVFINNFIVIIVLAIVFVFLNLQRFADYQQTLSNLEECANDPDWTPNYDNDIIDHNDNTNNNLNNNNNSKPLTTATNSIPKSPDMDRQTYILGFLKHSITSDLSKCKINSFQVLIRIPAFSPQLFKLIFYSRNKEYFGGDTDRDQLLVTYYPKSQNYKSSNSPVSFLWHIVNDGKPIKVKMNDIRTKVDAWSFGWRRIRHTYSMLLTLSKKVKNTGVEQKTGAKI